MIDDELRPIYRELCSEFKARIRAFKDIEEIYCQFSEDDLELLASEICKAVDKNANRAYFVWCYWGFNIRRMYEAAVEVFSQKLLSHMVYPKNSEDLEFEVYPVLGEVFFSGKFRQEFKKVGELFELRMREALRKFVESINEIVHDPAKVMTAISEISPSEWNNLAKYLRVSKGYASWRGLDYKKVEELVSIFPEIPLTSIFVKEMVAYLGGVASSGRGEFRLSLSKAERELALFQEGKNCELVPVACEHLLASKSWVPWKMYLAIAAAFLSDGGRKRLGFYV